MTIPIFRRNIGDDDYQDYSLEGFTCTVGRSKDCDIAIDDSSLSRLHMRLENREGNYFVVDNNSSNGTYLNRRKIVEAPLIDGDQVMAGRILFHFLREETPGTVTRPLIATNDSDESRTISVTLDSTADSSFNSLPLPPTLSEPQEAMPAPGHHIGTMGDLEAAEPLRRLAAVFIDCGVTVGLSLPTIALAIFQLNSLSSLFALLCSLATMAHVAVGWMKHRKTLGKHLLGLHIELLDDPEAQELPARVVLLRLVTSFLAFTILFDDQRRGIHDKLAGTRVVRS